MATTKEASAVSDLLDVRECAAYLRVSQSTIAKLQRLGKLTPVRLGDRVFFLRSSLDDFLAAGGARL